ncbi:MAG: DUF429 domain-containing protein [Methyloligellaceae bacterium]
MTGRGHWVAGVDGCPAGWVAVCWDGIEAHVALCAEFTMVLDLPEAPGIVAVDIPIGLPEQAERGGRACDVEARAGLGDRQSAVFAVPARAALAERDYARACAVALEHSEPPRKISKQCFNLFPKIREVDALMTPALQERVFECHPEAAFRAMNGARPLPEPKKVKSRPYDPGLDLRRRLLEHQGFPADFLRAVHLPRSKAGPDDILDACACAWTAARIARGAATRVPDDPPVDANGLRMEIWA